ncbi:MAG: hypothetical protein CSA15_05950 [Candidatus Delongbacteria bacterium]|nr:MAG: hypothetical protein CSA15_05950 [Candidatus Delongbacteria bacterium]
MTFFLLLVSCNSRNPVLSSDQKSNLDQNRSIISKSNFDPKDLVLAPPSNNPANEQSEMFHFIVNQLYKIFFNDYYYENMSESVMRAKLRLAFNDIVKSDALSPFYYLFGEEGEDSDLFLDFCDNFRAALNGWEISYPSGVSLSYEGTKIIETINSYDYRYFSDSELRTFLYNLNCDIKNNNSIKDYEKKALYQITWLIWEQKTFLMNKKNLEIWFAPILDRASQNPPPTNGDFWDALWWGFKYGLDCFASPAGMSGLVTVNYLAYNYTNYPLPNVAFAYVGCCAFGGAIGGGVGYIVTHWNNP